MNCRPNSKVFPKGAIVIPSSLRASFRKESPSIPKKISITLGAWGTRLQKTFKLYGLLDRGSGLNVIYMNPSDLQDLGFQYSPYTIGVEQDDSRIHRFVSYNRLWRALKGFELPLPATIKNNKRYPCSFYPAGTTASNDILFHDLARAVSLHAAILL